MGKKSGRDSSDDDSSSDKWSGTPAEMDAWEKKTARWCRKKWGTFIGNLIWENSLPNLVEEDKSSFNDHCTEVWESINDSNSTKAKDLWPITSGFWSKKWQAKWRIKQYDKLFDKIEASVTGSAALEVANLGMGKASEIRAHLMRQFGGAGEDLQARQDLFELGLPKSPGAPAFPEGVDIAEKLRELEAERFALDRLCPKEKRSTYEFGQETTLVKIALRHLRHTSYQPTVKALLAEIKARQEMKASLPVWNEDTMKYTAPLVTSAPNTDDWDYRNFHQDWLPTWKQLKSKLISVYKEATFIPAGSRAGSSSKLPTMFIPVGGGDAIMGTPVSNTSVLFMPGAGTAPRIPRCFGCGEHGHRKGDPGCKAKPEDWHECTPERFLDKIRKSKKRGVDGMSSKRKGDGICWAWRDTGKCSRGPSCSFQHPPKGGGVHQGKEKKVRLTKAEKKTATRQVTAAAIKSLKQGMKKKAKDKGRSVEDADLSSYLASLMVVRTIPRICYTQQDVDVSTMATKLLDVDKHICHDSGSGAFISVDKRDFVYLDGSAAAKNSVCIRGPSVGTPGCGGIGPLVFRCEIDGRPYGIVHPDGVYAEAEVEFRVSSERVCKQKGLRVVSGKFNDADYLECIRTNKRVAMKTIDNILVMETKGMADEIVDSPAFRSIVEEVKKDTRSPLVDLTPFLPGHYHDEKKEINETIGDWPYFKAESSLMTFLLLNTHCTVGLNYTGGDYSDDSDESDQWHLPGISQLNKEEDERALRRTMSASILATTTGTTPITTLVFNEAKATAKERSRLWCRRFAYCDTALFGMMASMPEYGDFPLLPQINEDNIVADQAKFTRKSFPRNDQSIQMNCPPWWRVYVDGYGGQNSLGGESYEGAVGSYLFVCCSTGSADVRLYASHEQFAVALHQFLRRVEAEHYKVHVLYCDTFSVNISEDVEDVCYSFECVLSPVSAGTPQEMAFAESMVRVVKRMSTAMLAGAPHLPADSWACADKYAVYIHDFLPSKSRGGHCPFVLRTGKVINWKILGIHTFGAPLQYSPMDGPVHKRAPITLPGWFQGIQWPAAIVRRASDMKLLNVAKQKMRVHEKAYCAELSSVVGVHGQIDLDNNLGEVEEDFTSDLSTQCSSVEDNVSKSGGQPDLREELDKNMVTSIKSLREHRFRMPGTMNEDESDIERSARLVNGEQIGGVEGLYSDPICSSEKFARLTNALKDAIDASDGIPNPSLRHQVLSRLEKVLDQTKNDVDDPGQLKIGKKRKNDGISKDNIVSGKRSVKNDDAYLSSSVDPDPISYDDPLQSVKLPSVKRKGKSMRIKRGDLVSLPASAFDGSTPGSYSDEHPEPCVGSVLEVSKEGLVDVRWLEDEVVTKVRLKDLTLVVRKASIANILVLLVEGEKVAFESADKSKWPKNFFELLVRKDWRKWVASVKKELEGWDLNNAVTVVDIAEVPKGAKVVPLGELYTIKRDGRYKFRQYLMGNLLRPGVDFGETFSTTVSGSGVCSFYSVATTCDKEVWGWDAVCGYLQAKEQYDIYAFLPSHHQYSDLEYEELEVLRKEFLKIVATDGEAGIQKFASKHKRDSRMNPRTVLKCNSSIYGCPGAGAAFEMLVHSVHTKVCGCTQTEVEPSIYVKIIVDGDDKVTGYLIAAAFVDDLRFFGTKPEMEEYMKNVKSKLKVTFTEPPVEEFISIQTFQCMQTHTTELKMPAYFEKAAAGYASLYPKGMKSRFIPLTTLDEKLVEIEPTEVEIENAKHLPFRELLGVLSYPASQCKFEMKYAVSILGSRRSGWSKEHFTIVLKVLEYGLTTKDIGIMYSKGLDPHGDNTLYCYADASLRVPRSWGCQICMLNGAAVLYKAKKQSKTAPSACHSEIMSFFDGTTYCLGLRNLLSELGMYQEAPTRVYQDNESAEKIMNNRGSLGVTSRAMDLEILSSRNRIEDQLVSTKWKGTKDLLADLGTKALALNPFARLRDSMNGYLLVKAAYPNKIMPTYVYDGEQDEGRSNDLSKVQAMIMRFSYLTVDSVDEVGSSS